MRTIETIDSKGGERPAQAEDPALTNFVFREAKSTEELLSLLRLRYRIYMDSRLSDFVEENKYGIDIDSYDFRARHFGLFHISANGEKPAGYFRVVEGQIVPDSHAIIEIVKSIPDLLKKINLAPEFPFPLMNYNPNAENLLADYRNWTQAGERMCEASRFVIDDSFRSPRIASFMIESALAIYYFTYHFKHAIGLCIPSHSAVYQRFYGMQVIGSEYEVHSWSFNCLIGSPSTIPVRLREKLVQMAAAYKAFGRIEHRLPLTDETALSTPVASRAVA